MAARKKAGSTALMNSGEFSAARIMQTMHIMHKIYCMHLMQIMNITLTLAMNFKNLMAPRKKAVCTALMNSGEFLAACIRQTMHIMYLMHCMHVTQIMNITLTLAINFKNLLAPR